MCRALGGFRCFASKVKSDLEKLNYAQSPIRTVQKTLKFLHDFQSNSEKVKFEEFYILLARFE